MRTCLSWIHPHSHGAILRHLLNMINSFLCSFSNYFENQLLPNNLIIVRNHGDDQEDERDIKRALERQGDVHINVKIFTNQLTSTSRKIETQPLIKWCQISDCP
jgi:hypothetical protein